MSIQEVTQVGNISFVDKTPDMLITNDMNIEASFSSLMVNEIAEVNESINIADGNLAKIASGKEISTHDLMISLEQAKYQLELAMKIKNKLVESYKEVMRMQL